MAKRSFTWNTNFKSIIVVDSEMFVNTYDVKLHIQPVTGNLQEQSYYFERLKILFSHVFGNTIILDTNEPLYRILKTSTSNRFVQLPKPPFDQIMSGVCFTKSNSVLDGKIFVNQLDLSSYQGDGITYSVAKDSPELDLLDVDNWFSENYNNFDPWWLRGDTATYDEELKKGIYTGHFNWTGNDNEKQVDDKEKHAKIFKFNSKVIEGGEDKKK